MSEKITLQHLQRAAYIYVRQSSQYQVLHHRESSRRQYALTDRAKELGFQKVILIDEDQGRSGSGAEERPGFNRLVSAFCQSKVGAVLSPEASRLARNNRDWHHLIDLCGLTDTLVVDQDGVYDPRRLNDRLLLGLKGTMSEFELSLFRQRVHEALHEKARRGELITTLPIGYVRGSGDRIEMTPDRQIQEAVRILFTKFRELGSARQVLLWYHQEGILFPAFEEGLVTSEVIWRLPGSTRVMAVLKNPIYAGVFVYGRRKTRTIVKDGRTRKTSGHMAPMEEWEVLLRDHHEAYISWEEYMSNQEQLRSNLAGGGRMKSGAVKSGPALLAGLLRCGRCGRKLHVGYSGLGGRVPRYYYRGGQLNHGTPWCISLGGIRVRKPAMRRSGPAANLTRWNPKIVWLFVS